MGDEGSQSAGSLELTMTLDLLEEKPKLARDSASYLGQRMMITQPTPKQAPPGRACHLVMVLAWYRLRGQENDENSTSQSWHTHHPISLFILLSHSSRVLFVNVAFGRMGNRQKVSLPFCLIQ